MGAFSRAADRGWPVDRDSTGLEVTRRHLPRLVVGLAVLVGYRSALAQPMQRKTKIERKGSRPSTKRGAGLFQRLGPLGSQRIFVAAKNEECIMNISFENKVTLVTGAASG